MCDLDHAALAPLAEDEYVLDTPRVRGFVADVRALIARAGSPVESVEALEPLFTELLADETWLPAEFQAPAPESGMGGGIGQWLVFRAADRSLSLFSLVVPPGSMTPVHDHLAWGLVGLYRGNQDEEFYRPREGGLDVLRRRPLARGDFYALLPPQNDIHRVRTTSDGDLRLDPPARERHGLRRPPHVRRADGRGAAVSLGLCECELRGLVEVLDLQRL